MNHNDENQSAEIDRTPLTYTDLKRWLGLLVLLISAALLAWALKSILLLFAVVFLVAMVLNPIVAFLERRHIHRGLAVALLALGFIALFALALSFLIPPLLTQVDELIRQTPEAWNRVQAQVQAFGQRYPSIQQAVPEADKVLEPSVRGPVTCWGFSINQVFELSAASLGASLQCSCLRLY